MSAHDIHNPGARVTLNGNRSKDTIETGQELPYLVQIETPSSCTVLIDSADRYTGDAADFRVRINPVVRPRYMQMKRFVLPKLPNVNANNNTISIHHADGDFTVTLTPGIYNTTTLANELTTRINAGLAGIVSADTVTTTYNPLTRNFTTTSVTPLNWYFINTSSFITRGQNLAGFSGFPVGTALTVSTHSSGIAGMLYCKYVTISSQMLTQHAYATSLLSNPLQKPQLVAVVDVTSIYSPADFDVSVPYSGVYTALDVWAPKISVMNHQRSTYSDLDFTIRDEYGFLLSQALDIGITSTLSSVMLYELSF